MWALLIAAGAPDALADPVRPRVRPVGAGATRFVTRAGGQRYLRITLDVLVWGDAAIALLAHELQHAWEIAQAPWVIDQATLGQLYRRIGHAGCVGTTCLRYDTAAARDASRTVSLELGRGPR